MIFSAATVLMSVVAGATLWPARAQQGTTVAANNTPLSFGMDAQEVSLALGTTLNYIRGRPGDELYLAWPNVKGSALSDRRDGLYLKILNESREDWFPGSSNF